MKAIFLKRRLYKNRMIEKGSIVDMDLKTFKAYEHYRVVKLYITPTKKAEEEIPKKDVPKTTIKKIEDDPVGEIEEADQTSENIPNLDIIDIMTVKELQELCKKHGKKSTGKKQDLIDSLKDYFYHNDDS